MRSGALNWISPFLWIVKLFAHRRVEPGTEIQIQVQSWIEIQFNVAAGRTDSVQSFPGNNYQHTRQLYARLWHIHWKKRQKHKKKQTNFGSKWDESIKKNSWQNKNTFEYPVFAPMGRFQLELVYLYFPPSTVWWKDGGK